MKKPFAFLALCAILAAIGPPALAQEPSQWRIFVRYRQPNPYCAGFCPSYEMRVDSDGEVTTQDLPERPLMSGHRRAKPENLRQFRAILDTLRPAADRRANDVCVQANRGDSSPDPLDNPK